MSNNTSLWRRIRYGIGARIIIPFLLLTLLVAGIGTFIITSQFTQTVNERYNTQLVDAGRVVSERMVDFEDARLSTLRTIAGTQGVAQGLLDGDTAVIEELVMPVILNDGADAVELLDKDGLEIYGWQRLEDVPLDEIESQSGRDFSSIDDVALVLEGYTDESGDKRVILSETPEGYFLFTLGPVLLDGEQVGAAMVGTSLQTMAEELSQYALARVTLYAKDGRVLETTLGSEEETGVLGLPSTSLTYTDIVDALREKPERAQVVATKADSEVPLAQLELMGQIYRLAFGDWRLRGQSFGLYSVAFPTNFVASPLNQNRDTFLVIFTVTFLAVLIIGSWTAQRITKPLSALVLTATAVGEGHLDQRTGINRQDEIGQLAASFDLMTARLENRTQQLIKQTSELETILNTITDGVILLDNASNIVVANVAAEQLLTDLSYDFLMAGPIRELLPGSKNYQEANAGQPDEETDTYTQIKQYQIGRRNLMTLATEVMTPAGEHFGTVLVLRDVTREVEAEHLKDAFITSISRELRTPLNAIQVYTDLLLKTGNDQLDGRQLAFVRNIQKGSSQLEHHLDQLIHISEIQAGTVKLDRRQIQFSEVVQAAVDNWHGRFEAKRIDLHLQLPDESPSITADQAQIGWVIESLLSNAHNYTPSGGQVEVQLTKNEHVIHLDVIDSGIGIAKGDQAHLFDRFFRAQNSVNHEMRGVGLGLFIARTVVDMHQGDLQVESELGHGSTFRLTLPLDNP
ncbi:MAG: HAMP domain-containing protein [Anaerolineales bacterium]|nr:HAMP domain-containing protein [Anaerolineales bacterium]